MATTRRATALTTIATVRRTSRIMATARRMTTLTKTIATDNGFKDNDGDDAMGNDDDTDGNDAIEDDINDND
jgi:hypothetical protein